ncbi:ATP-dependent Clp protease ATP-binding subunit [Caldalkalibacillus salinus]|uniref:ATP-dependent Clp protease ATP-binding subunit n=1 Tax=Caldalkalibacillus salinus TaxID=2803787 RepID=UPI0019209E7E|nr:ATP-dependent Clp protease ATP-binding subunit [Caldalkalibacillus salinus]
MLCDHCHLNNADIKMFVQTNGQKHQLNLCESCYRELRAKMSSSDMNPMMDGSSFNDFIHGLSSGDGQSKEGQSQKRAGGGLLDELGTNLTESAKAGLIDPVIGRDKEVTRVIEALNRRHKNNPVLIGEPGVGKTAIAEGLALNMIEGQVPSKLTDKEIYLLDVASLVSNTGIRGQFEERMKNLVAELQERQNVILFVDEIHLIVGAGSAEGSMDAGNILKPALARGELQLIGATTLKEYRQIEKDAALERRLQPVMVHEPTVEDAIQILKGIQTKYEDYHGVQFTNEAIEACVNLSHRYIQDRHLPDKAIDLLDEAGSKANLSVTQRDTTNIENQIEQVRAQKEEATRVEDYEQAAKLRDNEQTLLEQLEQVKTQNEGSTNLNVQVKATDIQHIVENKTGIPVSRLQEDEQYKLRALGQRLSSKVIGQSEAIDKVTKAIRRSRTGLKRHSRPVGTFLFVGPTGVGKTELSKSLAEELFGDRDAMIRLDMSEFMEKHAVSKLIGSPPGYVGHEEAGQLTEKVRRQPYSIILLDEIEKAHPDVQHMFLQILEDGHLTDSQGRRVSFRDTVIIMTSNAGVTERKGTLGFAHDAEAQQSSVVQSLSGYFKPEFLNRFDSIIEFQPLGREDLLKIVDIMLEELQTALAEQNMTLNVTSEAKEKLVTLGHSYEFGARPLRRVVQEQIEDRITDILLESNDVTHITVHFSDHGQLKVTSNAVSETQSHVHYH